MTKLANTYAALAGEPDPPTADEVDACEVARDLVEQAGDAPSPDALRRIYDLVRRVRRCPR